MRLQKLFARIGVRAVVIVFGIAMGLGVLEFGLRVGRHRSAGLNALLYSSDLQTEYDDVATTEELLARGTLGYKPLGHTPGFVLNSRGFRTDEYTEEKPADVFRVVALGDSFTFDSYGVPIDQMWHQVFEQQLSRRSGRRVQVLSLSAPAVGPRFELRLWELEGRRLDPDLVVLAFFVGNDFTDEAGVPLDHGLDAGLARHSLTFRLLRNWVRLRTVEGAPALEADTGASDSESRGGFELPGYAATYDPDVPTYDAPTFERIERDRLRIYAGPDRARFEALLADAGAVVERLAREVQRSGADIIVLLIPDRAQTELALQRRLQRTLEPGERELELDRPQRRLGAFLSVREVPTLDLLATFRGAPPDPALYKRRDPHWSAAGNRLAGITLADFVVAHGLGPGPEMAGSDRNQPSPGSSW